MHSYALHSLAFSHLAAAVFLFPPRIRPNRQPTQSRRERSAGLAAYRRVASRQLHTVSAPLSTLLRSFGRWWYGNTGREIAAIPRHPDADGRTSCSPLDLFHDRDLWY